MAPVTRRSQQANGSGIAKKAPTRKTRSASIKEPTDTWSLDVPRSRGLEQPAENVDEVLEDAAQVATTSADVSDALNPLREMAEKVGREVETFAEDLDKFLESLPSRNNYGVVLDLVDNFRAVAVDSAASLAQNYEKDRAQQLRNEWSVGAESVNASNALVANDARPASSKKQSKHVRQLRAWQQEADIWDLFRIVLEEHYNPDKAAVQQKKSQALSDLGPVHRYTTEADIWSRFIIDNDLARERVKIKKWLEQAADHQESSIEDISAELEAKSGRGKGLWSQGWLHTREKVKHEKRLRPWSNSAPASLPQIKNSDGNGLLASHLDPDAATRQERSVEQPDAYFERAFWTVCWEMLRRGKSWVEISDWCDARREGWRAALIEQPSQSHVAASSSQWRSVCRIASRTACSCDYEAAVYGLLGGNALATQKVCHTIDEQLYAYYSTALTRQFDQYLASNFPDRAANQRRMVIDDDLQNPQEAITALIVKLRTQQKTKHEAGQPMKTVQSYLLANEAESLIHTIGFALSDNDKLTKKKPDEDMIIQFGQLNSAEEAEAAIDPQALRIIAHISIILNVLSNNSLEGEERDAEENVLVAYIQTLRVARKRDLIPVYASRLSVARYVLAISRVMQDITSSREQEQTLKLLENYGLDIIMILKEQLAFLLNRLMALPRPKRALTLLEATKVTPLYPGSRIIENFLPTEFTDDDDAVIRSLQWFYILHGRWNDTFQALSSALRQCLMTGRLASALLIVEQFPYETVSIRKSYQVIGKSVNLMDHDGPAPDDEQPVWDLLKRQSRTYYELEQLVNAIKALADWRDKESDYTKKAPKLSSAPPALRAAKDAVDEAMLPVLGGLLCNPLDAHEAEDLDSIRLAYVPELILAYNTVLHSAGSLISRDNLIQSMDLSTTIAQDQNDIAQCFVRAKRMRELVMSFAETSKAMLVLKEAGRPWRPKKEREGKDLGLWEIGPQAHQIGELPNGQQREAQHA